MTRISSSPSSDAPAVVIERAALGDALLLARVAAALFEQTFADANTPQNMATYVAEAFSEAHQRRELADDHNRIWFARDGTNGSVIGYAHLRLDAAPSTDTHPRTRAAEISRLYADRSWHGRGVGAALMRTCVDAARENGAGLVWLGVWEHNGRAIAFYRRQGFKAIGEQSFILGTDRQRDVVMALELMPNGSTP
jgi:ribosomal protein S18 acetylase RimI-like enzyme